MQPQIAKAIVAGNTVVVDALCKSLGQVSGTRITVILPSGVVIGDTDEEPANMENHDGRPEILEAKASGMGSSIRHSSTLHQRMMYRVIRCGETSPPLCYIRTAIPITFLDEALTSTRLRMFIDGLFIAIIAAVIGLVVSRRLSRPLEVLRQGADCFASGDLDSRLRIHGASVEIDALSQAMNTMAEQLGQRIAIITSQRQEQEAILYSMVEGVLAVDADARLISVNKAATRFFSLDANEVLGRTLHQVIRNPALQKTVDDALATRRPVRCEIIFAQGKMRIAQVSATVLQDALRHDIGALVVFNDITRIRKLENMRRDFVANVSHELKTPVTSIRGFVETLLDGAIDTPEDGRRFLGIIARQADRLNAIIEDLLSLSRIEKEAEEEKISLIMHPLDDVIEGAVTGCQPQAQAKSIIIVAEKTNLEARVNPRLLEQAVINLLTNAITYSDSGATVTVSVEANENDILMAVTDTGCGISAIHHERLFERFYRVDKGRSREAGGTGLGLAIVKHIALAHGGTVNVRSQPGEGSCFTIGLPRDL